MLIPNIYVYADTITISSPKALYGCRSYFIWHYLQHVICCLLLCCLGSTLSERMCTFFQLFRSTNCHIPTISTNIWFGVWKMSSKELLGSGVLLIFSNMLLNEKFVLHLKIWCIQNMKVSMELSPWLPSLYITCTNQPRLLLPPITIFLCISHFGNIIRRRNEFSCTYIIHKPFFHLDYRFSFRLLAVSPSSFQITCDLFFF